MEGANIVIERADEALANEELERAMTIYLCVLHEIVPALQYADDSGGDIGGVIEEALSGITNIADSEEPMKYKDSIFDTLIKESKNNIYDGWDWQLDILRACTEICNNTERRRILEQTLDSLIKSETKSYSSNYLSENVAMMKHSLISKFDGEQGAKAFVTANINLPKFREIAINDAISRKDYMFAEEIALQGEAFDKSLPGLVNRWKDFRYKIYELSGDTEKLRILCMDFILDGSMDYYKKLKATFGENEWQINYPKIIALLEAAKKGYVRNYTDILIEEKEYGKLLEHVKKNPRQVESYYKHLISDFRQDIIQIFVQNIIKDAESASDRKTYQTVCAKLKLLASIGGNNEALGLRYDFLERYKKRPAMKDELMRMKLV